MIIKEEMIMKKYVCDPCGWIYDPEAGDPDGGIEPGTAFEAVSYTHLDVYKRQGGYAS